MVVTGISFNDILISFLYIIIIIAIAFAFKPKKDKIYKAMFLPFILSKVFAAILFVLIHVYYYKGGDTFLYFSGANFFSNQITSNFSNILQIFFSTSESIGNIAYESNYVYALNSSEDVFFLSKLIGLLSFLTGNQYLACNILYTILTGIGVWKLYITFCELYPNTYKLFAIGILFYPSLSIWGSGVLKDPLTLACVGLIFWSSYNLINRRKIITSITIILICIFFCYLLKPYILYTFIPIMLLWAQGLLTGKIKSPIFKILITPIILAGFGAGGYFFINSISSGAGKYSLENVQSVAEGFHSWHTYLAETRDQSGYSLGEVEFTPLGVLAKAPEGFFVTYFRPFLFGDVRNVATLFEAIQTFILLILYIYVFFKVGIINFFKIIFFDKHVRVFMLFSITFGIAVGLTSYNFGALSRYKIPSLPFFTASLAIIYYLGYMKKKNLSNI